MHILLNALVTQIQKMHVFIVIGLLSMNTNGAAPALPNFGGVTQPTADSDPIDVVIAVFKYVGAAMVWIAVAWFGLQLFWAVIKAANEARGGDASWMEAGKAMVGNVVMFVLFLAIAIWYTAAFLSA